MFISALRHRVLILIAALGLSTALSACGVAGLALGGAAGVGVSAYSERGVDGVARDLALTSRVMEKLTSHDHALIAKVGVDVFESRALLTGQVETEDQRADVVRLAWQVDGIVDVINEVHVTTEGGIMNTARDAWISTQLETKLTFDKQVLAINYSIETTGATVYLLGIAQSAGELQRVRDHARSIDYVRRIVSHVRIKDPLPTAPNMANVQ